MLSHGDSICHFNGKCGLNNWNAAGEVAEGVHHTHFGRCDAGIPSCIGACHVCHAGFDQVVSGIEVDRQCNFASTVCHDGQAHVRHVFNRQCNASRGGYAGCSCQHSAVGIDGRSNVLIAVNDGVNNGGSRHCINFGCLCNGECMADRDTGSAVKCRRCWCLVRVSTSSQVRIGNDVLVGVGDAVTDGA